MTRFRRANIRPYCIGTSYRTNFSIETIISSRSPCRRFDKSVHHRVQPPREASGSFFSPYRCEEILLCMHARSDRACGVSEEPPEQPVITRIADRSVSPFLYLAVCFTLHPVSGPWNSFLYDRRIFDLLPLPPPPGERGSHYTHGGY